MKRKSGLLVALILGTMLTACASSGTRVSGASETYRTLASSQQWWCGTFGATCQCSIDGVPATCSLVFACLNSGSCKAAQ